MQANAIFKELIQAIGITLQNHEFKRYGNSFYQRKTDNWGLIEFQKSTRSTKFEILFTINIGICSEAIKQFRDSDQINQKPSFDECQWKIRIGTLIANNEDKWWAINDLTNTSQLVDEIQSHLINIVLPEMQNNMTDEQLMTLWLSGKSQGLTEVERLVNLCILLKKFGMHDQLAITLAQLEQTTAGKASASMVKVIKQQLLT